MLADSREIIREVSTASNLDEALAIFATRVKDYLPIDAFAIYLIGAEAGQYVLKASDTARPEAKGQVCSGAEAGLMGLVSKHRELVVLNNASAHPRYAPAAETGGQPFDTFLGILLIHHHQVLGVLVVWKRVCHQFEKNELSFLVSIAAQFAKAVYDASNVDPVVELVHNEAGKNTYIQGIQAASGVAIGTATLIDRLAKLESVPDRRAEDINAQEVAFRAAVLAIQAELGASSERLNGVVPKEVCELFEVYIMLLGDDSLVADTLTRIRAGNWAPGSWRDTISEHAQAFDRMEDPYLRARGEDIRELGTRVLIQLQLGFKASRLYPERCILVGDAVSIQDIALVPTGRLAGVVSAEGSAFSHIAVLSNALGIPAVVSLSSPPVCIVEGATVAVDGDNARIYVNPSLALLNSLKEQIEPQIALSPAQIKDRDLPAQTLDGVRLPLHANIGLDSDIDPARNSEAEGVGLYRTEYQFLSRDIFPGEEEQYQCYRRLLEGFAPRSVTIRTLDVGGDKTLSYFPMEEDNPFLGVRGIRFSLAYPQIFMIQLRALLRANAGLENLQILFPMVAKVMEVDEALGLLARAHRGLLEEGQPAAKPKVGVMIEVPSAVFLTKSFATRVDFLSIGTNDLTQYILAADRTNARVMTANDALHPAVLNAISMIIRDAHAQDTSVTVCGEVAGDPAGAVLLLGIGVDALSMNLANFERVKLVIRAFTLKRARALANQALRQEDERLVRGLLNNALKGSGVKKHRSSLDARTGSDAGAFAG